MYPHSDKKASPLCGLTKMDPYILFTKKEINVSYISALGQKGELFVRTYINGPLYPE